MIKRVLATVTTAAISVLIFGAGVLAAPQTMSDGQAFDPVFYAQTYPDVANALGTDSNVLYQHYLTCGKAEGRLPYSANSMAAGSASLQTMSDGGLFDPVYYAAQNPDVAAVFGTDANALYQHYLTCGKNEGRQPYEGSASASLASSAQAVSDVPQTLDGATYIGSAFGANYYLRNAIPAKVKPEYSAVWKGTYDISSISIKPGRSMAHLEVAYQYSFTDPTRIPNSTWIQFNVFKQDGSYAGRNFLLVKTAKTSAVRYFDSYPAGNYFIQIANSIAK